MLIDFFNLSSASSLLSPRRIFSFIDELNNIDSWLTTAIIDLRSDLGKSFTSKPSIIIFPEISHVKRNREGIFIAERNS